MAKRFKDVPNVPFAPVAAVLFALVVTALMFATPAWRLERLVTITGLAEIFSPARPPLGDTARALMAVTSGLASFVLLWAIMRPLEKFIHNRRKGPLTRSYTFGKKQEVAPVPAAASSRKPIFAADDLGAPLMSDAALSSGGELFLDAAMIDAPEAELILSPPDVMAVEAELPHVDAALSATLPTPVWAEPVIEDPTPSAATAEPASAETVIEWLTPEGGPDLAIGHVDPEPLVLDAPFQPAFENEAIATAPLAVQPIAAVAAPVLPLTDQQMPGVSDVEPTLRELLVKFEAALKRRDALQTQGRNSPAAMPETTAQSLRDLMASGRLR